MEDKKTEYTIKEVAKIMKVSTQTVKRKIDKGEISARKEVTDFGERWLIPINEVNEENNQIALIPTNEKQIVIKEIQKVIASVFSAQTQEIKSHIYHLEEKIEEQTLLIMGQKEQLDGHYRLVDERLRLSITEKKEQHQMKPFWKRIMFIN